MVVHAFHGLSCHVVKHEFISFMLFLSNGDDAYPGAQSCGAVLVLMEVSFFDIDHITIWSAV